MTNETFEQAQELVRQIDENKRTISILDTMLERFDDNSYTDISITCRCGNGDLGKTIHHNNLPELREALKKARERFKCELQQNQEKLEAL